MAGGEKYPALKWLENTNNFDLNAVFQCILFAADLREYS